VGYAGLNGNVVPLHNNNENSNYNDSDENNKTTTTFHRFNKFNNNSRIICADNKWNNNESEILHKDRDGGAESTLGQPPEPPEPPAWSGVYPTTL